MSSTKKRTSTSAVNIKEKQSGKKSNSKASIKKTSTKKGEGSLVKIRQQARQEAANAKLLKTNKLWQALISSPRKWYGGHIATNTLDVDLTKKKLIALEHYKKDNGNEDELKEAIKKYKKQHYTKDVFLRPLGGLGPNIDERTLLEKEKADKRRLFAQTVHAKNRPKLPKVASPPATAPTEDELERKKNEEDEAAAADEALKAAQAEKDLAATKIQKTFRGHRGRKRVKTMKIEKKNATVEAPQKQKAGFFGFFKKKNDVASLERLV